MLSTRNLTTAQQRELFPPESDHELDALISDVCEQLDCEFAIETDSISARYIERNHWRVKLDTYTQIGVETMHRDRLAQLIVNLGEHDQL